MLLVRFAPFAIAAAVAAIADAGTPVPDEAIDAIFAEWNTPTSPGAAVAVSQNGEVVFSKGYGLADLEQSTSIDANTIFHVASVSKQFTAFAILLLEADGKLSLDDDIREHLPEIHDFGVPVRIRQLIHHTSGIRDQWDLLIMAGWRWDDVITMDDIWELLVRQRELNFTPGEQYTYSNGGYTLLAFIVERVSGQSLPDFCMERIFKPLGMSRTHFFIDHTEVVPRRSYSYMKSGDGYRKSVLSYANVGATSLFTTAEDLLKWLENFYTAQVGGREVVDKISVSGTLNSGMPIGYGLGVGVGKYKGIDSISHSGGDAGFRSYVVTFPEHHLSVALASNLASFSAPGQALKVADLFLEEHLEDIAPPAEMPKPIDDAVLRAVRGTYADPITGRIQTFASRQDQLQLANPGSQAYVLSMREDGHFAPLNFPAHMDIRFYGAESGAAEKVDIALQGSPLATYYLTKPRPANPFYPLQFIGKYYSEELDAYWEIVSTEKGLGLKRLKYGVVDVQSSFTDGYATGQYRLYFTRDLYGRVDGMRVSTGRVSALKFERMDD